MTFWLKIFASIPALAFSMSALFFIRFFGFSSPWISVLAVSDYLDKASDFFPYAIFLVFGLSLMIIASPNVNVDDRVGQFAIKRLAINRIPDRWKALAFGATVVLILLCIPKWSVFIISILILVFCANWLVGRVFEAKEMQRFDKRLVPVVAAIVRIAIFSLVIVEWNAQVLRMSILEYQLDAQGARLQSLQIDAGIQPTQMRQLCSAYACTRGEMFVDHIQAGIISFEDGRIRLRNDAGDELLVQQFPISIETLGHSYGCDLVRALNFGINLRLCDAASGNSGPSS